MRRGIEETGACGRPGVKDLPVRELVHTWVKRRGPRSGESSAPARAGAVKLDKGVGAAVFVEARENHDAAVAQNGAGGIPPAVGHGLLAGEGIGGRIVGGGAQFAVERVVLESAAHDVGATVGKNDHAVAKHVPCHWLRGNGARLRIPKGSLKIRVARYVARAGRDKDFAVVEESCVDGINGHGVGQSLPLALGGGLRRQDGCEPNKDKKQENGGHKQTAGESVHCDPLELWGTEEVWRVAVQASYQGSEVG